MRYLDLELHFRATAKVSFPPNPVNTLRGAFGHHLKRAVCFHRANKVSSCRGCIVERTCVYSTVFETPSGDLEHSVASGGSDAPHPFVLGHDGRGPVTFSPHASFRFGLTLFGRAVDQLPYFVHAFREAGRGGLTREGIACPLTGVINRDGGARIFDADTEQIVPVRPSELRLEEPGNFTGECSRLVVTFESPTAFKDKRTGKIVNLPDFPRLVRSLLRRHSALCAFDDQPVPAWNYGDLIKRAETVRIAGHHTSRSFWERFSTKQEQRATFGGIIGDVMYEGDIGPFLPLLKAGELIRVGRGSVFGQGRFRVSALEPVRPVSIVVAETHVHPQVQDGAMPL